MLSSRREPRVRHTKGEAQIPNYHTPTFVEKATEVYRAITLELERRRQHLGWTCWMVDDAAGLQDGHWAKMLNADRRSGRCVRWETLQLVVSALYPAGFEIEFKHKVGDPLTAEKHRLKCMFAASDHSRLTRRALMRELGRRGAKARMEKLSKGARTKIAKQASKAAAIKRSERAAARAQTQISGTT